MKRISGKRSKVKFEIELEQQKYYFRGDQVQGNIILESPKPIKFKGIRLQWYGRVRVQLEPSIRDDRELFRETGSVDIPVSESESEKLRRDAVKLAATTNAQGLLIPLPPSKNTFYADPDKQYKYPFSLLVPANPILPSCTESDMNVGGIVEYVIEAYLERPTSDFSASVKTQIRVPVLQRIDTTLSDQIIAQSARVEYRQPSLSQQEEEDVATLHASVPSKAFVRNQSVPVTVDIKHFEPCIQPHGLTIALIRTCKIICKGVSYGLPDSVLHHIKADIDITDVDLSQTITRSILIPRSTTPTVGVNGHLIEIGYKLRVRARLQDDINTEYNMSVINLPADFQSLAYMTAEIPINVGTLPLQDGHIPPSNIDPQFVNFLDMYVAAKEKERAKEVGSSADKVHMLKKMQRMLRRSSGQASKSSATAQDTLPMTKTDVLTLFSDNESLQKRNSLNSSSESSCSGRESSTATQSQTTITSGEQSFTGSSHHLSLPPPPTSPPPKLSPHQRQALAPFRLSLGPEFSEEMLSSELKGKGKAKGAGSPTPSASSSTSLEHYKPDAATTPVTKHDRSQRARDQRRRVNSASIVLDHKRHSNIHKQSSLPPLEPATSDQKRNSAMVSFDGGIHYFYMFNESSSEEEEAEQQEKQRHRRKSTRRRRATTAAGFEKPNSASNTMDASDARVERPKVRHTKTSTSYISDKPDEITKSDTDSQLSCDEDLLDILQRRDKRLESRLSSQ